jgi:hypothetical protein
VQKDVALGGGTRLELRWEIFNLLNSVNFDVPNRVFGTSNFGRIFSAQPAHGLTMTASVGVCRSPVSRLLRGGVRRPLIAYSSPTPLGPPTDRSWCDQITPLTGRRRSERRPPPERLQGRSRGRPVSLDTRAGRHGSPARTS